jgi:hypothetical protein
MYASFTRLRMPRRAGGLYGLGHRRDGRDMFVISPFLNIRRDLTLWKRHRKKKKITVNLMSYFITRPTPRLCRSSFSDNNNFLS